jgi:hypothetical protein
MRIVLNGDRKIKIPISVGRNADDDCNSVLETFLGPSFVLICPFSVHMEIFGFTRSHHEMVPFRWASRFADFADGGAGNETRPAQGRACSLRFESPQVGPDSM